MKPLRAVHAQNAAASRVRVSSCAISDSTERCFCSGRQANDGEGLQGGRAGSLRLHEKDSVHEGRHTQRSSSPQWYTTYPMPHRAHDSALISTPVLSQEAGVCCVLDSRIYCELIPGCVRKRVTVHPRWVCCALPKMPEPALLCGIFPYWTPSTLGHFLDDKSWRHLLGRMAAIL